MELAKRIGGERLGGAIGGLLLVLIGLAVYGPGLLATAPIDRDESRFAQASRQMFESVALPPDRRDPALHSGGLAVPMVGAEPRLTKPPLIYWLQSASAWVCTGGDPTRDAIWMYRLPSVLAAFVAVLATWRLGCSMFGARTGWIAGATLAVCPMIVLDAHQARADQILLACTTVAMWALWAVGNGQRAMGESGHGGRAARKGEHDGRPSDGETDRRRDEADQPRVQARGFLPVLALWLAVGAGILAKGPITPMVVLLAVTTLCVMTRSVRWFRATRPLLGLLIVTLVIAPTIWAVARHIGWDQFVETIQREVLGRSGSAREGHFGPPGYHLLLMVGFFWPGSMLVGLSFLRAWRERRAAPHTFLLAWLVPGWVVFELVMTKLPHYTLPMYPALALLASDGLAHASELPLLTRGARALAVLWTLGGLLMVGGATWLVATSGLDALGIASLVVCAGAIVLALRAGHDLARARGGAALARGFAAIVAAQVVMWAVAIPRHATLSRDLWRIVEHADPDLTRPIAFVGYTEDSLKFWSRGRIIRGSEDDGPHWLSWQPDGLLIVPEPTLPTLGAVNVLGRATGINYSNGRRMTVLVVERAP